MYRKKKKSQIITHSVIKMIFATVIILFVAFLCLLKVHGANTGSLSQTSLLKDSFFELGDFVFNGYKDIGVDIIDFSQKKAVQIAYFFQRKNSAYADGGEVVVGAQVVNNESGFDGEFSRPIIFSNEQAHEQSKNLFKELFDELWRFIMR